MSMKTLISCEFNIDTACVELRYTDGETLSLYTPGIEDSFDTTLPMRTELDWLIYSNTRRWRSTGRWNNICENPPGLTGWRIESY